MILGSLSKNEQIGIYGAVSVALALFGNMTVGFLSVLYVYAVKPLVLIADSILGTGYRPAMLRYQGQGIDSFGAMIFDSWVFALLLFPIAVITLKFFPGRWSHLLIFAMWYLAIFVAAQQLGTLTWAFPLNQ